MCASLVVKIVGNYVSIIGIAAVCLLTIVSLEHRESAEDGISTVEVPVVEVRVTSVLPDTVSFRFEDVFIRATSDEMAQFAGFGLDDVSHGFHMYVEITNTSDNPILLSRHDLWRLLAGNARFVLDNGSQWGSRLTVRLHPIDPVFDIPVLANSTRQMQIPIDGAEIAPAAGRQPGREFEGEFDFKLQRAGTIRARRAMNGILHDATRVVVRAVGRGEVAQEGLMQ